ncbi:MarR family winged helix-turn-helix transcriptional regulator [Petrocella sp. FN5]|uniref:MarR family winged helix-turn-helix transcriptional regulator n=1 Tax=Petrocella sp. FN5 TaxID=3032002 RepID=UPI0023DAB8BA|nr:MarR family transcriptional regulator [Petrocella sp. FN5]MDF1616911.1 MarR family transcriptional regulator [Petrocella sp. FN5]
MYDLENMDPRYLVFGNIFLLSNRLQNVMDQNATDLTAKQWFVLMMLGMFDDPPTLKELAAMCDSSHQNIKQLVLKLEKKGFVRIEKDLKDRRALRIAATPKCQEWEEENRSYTQNFVNTMFGTLTKEEIATLNLAQQKIYTTLSTMKEEEL